MSAPRVYAAIVAITAELAKTGIPKSRTNSVERYAYRGIDDVCERLAPLLARHRLCVLPRVLERNSEERRAAGGEVLANVSLRVAFDVVSARDGSSHTIEVSGEALDGGDKATSKAMSAAYKQAMLQLFCIPVQGADDPDSMTHRLARVEEQRDPDQGWDQWSADIQDMLRICQTIEAVDRVQETYRDLLRALSKRRPELFTAIGNTVRDRRLALSAPATLSVSPTAERALEHG